ENRILDVPRLPHPRHPRIKSRNFPERAALVLTTKRRKGQILSAALSQPRAEQTRMRQQVRGQECSVAVPTDADAIAIADTHFDDFVDRCLRAGNKLLDVSIVGGFTTPDNRHSGIVENRVTRQQQEHVRITADDRETIWRAGDLTG